MKKILFMCILMFALILSVVAQTTGTSPPVIEFAIDLSTIAGAAAAVLLITGWIKTAFKLEGMFARWVSWLVAIIITVSASLLNIGMFGPLSWWQAIIYGFGIGLVSNGLFTAETIQMILVFFKAQVKKE